MTDCFLKMQFCIFKKIILKVQAGLLGKEIVMNCKFHPEAEAVTTCAVCGAGMCSVCDAGAFYENDGKSVCLECSLKGAEEELMLDKVTLKDEIRDGIISSIVWFAGIALGGIVHEVFYLLMLVAPIVFCRTTLFMSDERGFYEKIKDVFWRIILIALLCPLFVIYCLISYKIDVVKVNRKVKKIKAALGNASR